MYRNDSLFSAIAADQINVVAAMLADPRARPHNPVLFSSVCGNRQTKMLKVLLNDMRVFPGIGDLQEAVRVGDLEIVSILMDSEKVDASANDNQAMRLARDMENEQMQRILSRDKNVR